MGLTGLVAFAAIVGAMFLRTLRLARLARTDDTALAPLGWWSVSWVMLVSAWARSSVSSAYVKRADEYIIESSRKRRKRAFPRS